MSSRLVRTIAVVIMTILLLMAMVAAAPSPVALDIRNPKGSAPFTTQVRITVEPNTANRWLCLQWTQIQGGTRMGSSCWQLEAERAPKTHWRVLKRLASGRWDVVAYIVLNDEKGILSNRIILDVLGPNYESPPDMFDNP